MNSSPFDTMRFYLTRFFFLICLLLSLVSVNQAHAATVITQSQTDTAPITLQVPYFEDQTGSNSVVQAQVQLSRYRQNRQIQPSNILNFNGNEGTYWINLELTNNSTNQDFQLDLIPAGMDKISPIKSLAVYDIDAESGKPLAEWPNIAAPSAQAFVALPIAEGQTVNRFVLVQTWPGIKTTLMPQLKSKDIAEEEAAQREQKLGILWLVIGAVCGAALVQFILTKQVIQAVLALNGLMIGFGIFILQHNEIVPGAAFLHPLVLPFSVNAAIGISASLLLWTTVSRQSSNAMVCLLPLILNVLLTVIVIFKIDTLLSLNIGLEKLPVYLLMLNGLMLAVITVGMSFATLGVIWFMPAWLVLMAAPWLWASYPLVAAMIYGVLLAIGGVTAVFNYWHSMDKETEALQRRLRQELRANKDKYKEEHENWDKKMESQRVLLTELKQREQQRSMELEIAKKEADAANKAKSDFLAIISHEIRTPMNGIMGIVQIIEQTPLNEKQGEYIEIIKNSGESMVTLLNDILDYSKIEKGMIDLEIMSFSLRKLIQSVATLMSGRSRDKGIPLNIEIDEDLADLYLGDVSRIRQVLLNLVSNAIKFTERGSVTIRVKAVMNQNELVRFEIIDTGIGISQDSQGKLFQAYTQADSSINRRFGGTGLGLNICRMLVNAMDGHIGANSVEHQGSTFWFDIPLKISDGSGIVEVSKEFMEDYKPEKKLYILVIDDNDVNLKIVSSLLEMDGHEVVTALSGEIGLRLIDQDRFDVVFVDMLMPNMDGRTFVKTLRQNPVPVRANLPVFALTGLADKETITQIISQGILDVLLKPVNKAALRQALSKLFVGEKRGPAYEPAPVSPEVLMSQQTAALINQDAILNMSILGELKGSLPTETLKEIFTDLIDKSKELTDEMEQAAAAKDYTKLGEVGHNLKGMGGNFGLQALMEHSGLIENAVRDGQYDEAMAYAQNSRSVMEQSLAALNDWLES